MGKLVRGVNDVGKGNQCGKGGSVALVKGGSSLRISS